MPTARTQSINKKSNMRLNYLPIIVKSRGRTRTLTFFLMIRSTSTSFLSRFLLNTNLQKLEFGKREREREREREFISTTQRAIQRHCLPAKIRGVGRGRKGR
ncbi:hypothetical protein L6452_40666 [Arctium lappa]|uniref:Uncharacterized protein n=1 Tax=Arctium lappa TaxID=4217 RepID=A0ACB8XMJ1_ARCLA|nr:hypothetical protein L6452_40666 [Arctium lappa]